MSGPLTCQKLIEYECSSLDELPVYLDITYSSEPMEYFGQMFYILKYDLRFGSSVYHSFFTYKFNNKLYVLDDSAKTINYSKDQILFDINSESSMLTSTHGIFEDLELFDLSDNGATSWAWHVYDSVQQPIVEYYSTDKNPLINMSQEGKFTVALVSSNNKWGASTPKIKVGYIEVLPFQDFTIGAGPNSLNQKSGRFTDHAGNNNYGARRATRI